ncbi:MAG: MBL fold metallo-hydrolase, partial [Bacteroidetes bacterium]
IDDIRPFYFKQGDIPFYAHKRVFKALHKRFEYIFKLEGKYPGAPTIKEVEIDKDASFDLLGKTVIPIEAYHADLPILGFRIDNFTYLTDVKTIAEEEIEKIQGTDVLVISVLRIKPHNSHLNLTEALELIETIRPKTIYFTHISHMLGFHDEVEAMLPENIHLAYDTLKITL